VINEGIKPMKLSRLPYDPAALIDFFEEGLNALGAVSERSWHDRLQLVAEGRAAQFWNAEGALVEVELQFPPANTSGPRQADKEVFPGCPLTFRLAESLRPAPLLLERVVLQPFDQGRTPSPDVTEKVWHQQFSGCARWRLDSEFKVAWHFSLLALVRCEIQAIDQHWSSHRLALSFPDGQSDESLAASFDFAQVDANLAEPPPWPAFDLGAWQPQLRAALEEELAEELAAIRARQEQYLRRELERIDGYFAGYERELQQRHSRSHSEGTRMKTEQRLAAARAEHQRRRLDQVQRHEIRVVPHLDALLFVAEPAWFAALAFMQHHEPRRAEAHFVPRARRWVLHTKE